MWRFWRRKFNILDLGGNVFFFGRVLGAALGWLVAGPIGAIIGLAFGYFFDRAFSSFQAHFNPEKRAQVELALFNCIFPLLGHMAKADGRVSEEEVKATEALMDRMQLTPDRRKEAIALFKTGSLPEFDLAKSLDEFSQICGQYPDIKQILLVYLITLAMSDGEIHQQEEKILSQVALHLGYSAQAYQHLLRMAQAQGRFYQQSATNAPSSADQLKMAYEAMGVDPSVSDAELKKAYRKLMSQYHPDKLVGQGVPEHMVKVATERSQEIQTAYDLIKKSRKP